MTGGGRRMRLVAPAGGTRCRRNRRGISTLHRRNAVQPTRGIGLVREVQVLLKRVAIRVVFVTPGRRCRERSQNNHRISFHRVLPVLGPLSMGRGCANIWARQAPLGRLPKRAQPLVPIVIDSPMRHFQLVPQLRELTLSLRSRDGASCASTTDSSRAVVRARR